MGLSPMPVGLGRAADALSQALEKLKLHVLPSILQHGCHEICLTSSCSLGIGLQVDYSGHVSPRHAELLRDDGFEQFSDESQHIRRHKCQSTMASSTT